MSEWSMTEPTPIHDSYEAYGCRVNPITAYELFRKYEKAGFIYQEKRDKLAPFWEEVCDSWKRGLEAGEELIWFSEFEEEGIWSSVGSWRSTHVGWSSQHVVSVGGPRGSRASLLSGAAIRCFKAIEGCDLYQQNWFQPSKRMPMKIFGSIVKTMGQENAAVKILQYMSLLPIPGELSSPGIRIEPWSISSKEAFSRLASTARSRVYSTAEELNHEDGLLEGVDELYRKVGLRRYRRMWLAYAPGSGEPVAGIIAYRGPLGFNFSFLENRCDLLVRPEVSDDMAFEAIKGLVAAAWPTYEDFSPKQMFITCDPRSRTMIEKIGGQFIREYAQSVWLKDGYIGWYRHVEKFYDRIMKAERRRGLGDSSPGANKG